ncbi:STM4015 family protein [Streptomyces sp. NPDC048636]|uniref:STM4015 family protein n=1 Tax=Streptomyces sp. NPDC048636 TaxID=3155762 RepID=UPI00342633FC
MPDLEELHGLPAFDFPPDEQEALPAPDSVAWRICANPYDDADEAYGPLFQRFLDTVDVSRVRALITSAWGEYGDDSSFVIAPLVAAKDRFTSLEALFIGDIEPEEQEISWIRQSDVTPLLHAFPRLVELGVRGGTELEFPPVTHERLRTLRFETGGLPGEVVRGVGGSTLPALEHLEMWLGVDEYGGDAGAADLAPLLTGGRFPALRHLGLQNSEIQDEIAAAVAAAPLVAQLTSLDLSMGVLTDTGGQALLEGQPLTHLSRLNLDHNFFSPSMAQRLRDALEPSGVTVELDERGDEDHDGDEIYRYTAVAE